MVGRIVTQKAQVMKRLVLTRESGFFLTRILVVFTPKTADNSHEMSSLIFSETPPPKKTNKQKNNNNNNKTSKCLLL